MVSMDRALAALFEWVDARRVDVGPAKASRAVRAAVNMPSVSPKPLGLIAGEGVFPLLVARGAKRAGRRVVCVALSGSAWPELRDECDVFKWVGVLRLGQWVRVLRSAGVDEAIMVGRVSKSRMYSRWRYLQYVPDARTMRLWFTDLRRDKRPGAVLTTIAKELSHEGIQLIDSTTFTPEALAHVGVMTRREPSESQQADIDFGWNLCQQISRLDIGQAIAVLDKDVIAVEALEGTNAMIERAGRLCKAGGWTLIKVANSGQDMRMDVPTIGTVTIEKLAAAGAGCVVLQAGKTVILEKQKVLELADRYKIAVVGYEST